MNFEVAEREELIDHHNDSKTRIPGREDKTTYRGALRFEPVCVLQEIEEQSVQRRKRKSDGQYDDADQPRDSSHR